MQKCVLSRSNNDTKETSGMDKELKVNLYLAPMEGITGYVYRNALQQCFGGIDRYFTPFITTHTKKAMDAREKNDILPEHNEGIPLVPQIISKNAEDSIKLIHTLSQDYGYQEVNLNLGCPSGTVVAKGRGAGFLANPKELHEYLKKVYDEIDIAMSIKTRIGIEDPDEFHELLEIFNQFPVSELIVHPRVQKDFYKNTPNLEAYQEALEKCKCPVVYNGNIFGKTDFSEFTTRFPENESVMIGRGIISNPALGRELRGGKRLEKEEFLQFHDLLLQGYQTYISGDKNTLFKMKELWFYFEKQFDHPEKKMKKIKKAEHMTDYQLAVKQLLKEVPLKEDPVIRF